MSLFELLLVMFAIILIWILGQSLLPENYGNSSWGKSLNATSKNLHYLESQVTCPDWEEMEEE